LKSDLVSILKREEKVARAQIQAKRKKRKEKGKMDVA